MARAFSVMKTNVGNMIQDTSTATATLIGTWLNDKYRDISKRYVWSVLIDNDYIVNTATLTSGTASYDLPADFDEEIFVADVTDGFRLERYNEGNWWRERTSAYSGGTIAQGTSTRYVIEREAGHITFDPTPNNTHVIKMPYKKLITELSADASTVSILDIEYVMELGAIAEGMAYKKQFQKASYYLQRYEVELAKRIGQEQSAANQLYQWVPDTNESGRITRLTGDNSYDSL